MVLGTLHGMLSQGMKLAESAHGAIFAVRFAVVMPQGTPEDTLVVRWGKGA